MVGEKQNRYDDAISRCWWLRQTENNEHGPFSIATLVTSDHFSKLIERSWPAPTIQTVPSLRNLTSTPEIHFFYPDTIIYCVLCFGTLPNLKEIIFYILYESIKNTSTYQTQFYFWIYYTYDTDALRSSSRDQISRREPRQKCWNPLSKIIGASRKLYGRSKYE